MIARKTLVTTVVGGALAAAGIATAAPAMAAPFATITYDVNGTTRIGQQVNQNLQLGPSRITATLDLASGDISNGTLPLPTRRLSFPVFGGAFTLAADVSLIQSGKITGKLAGEADGTNSVTANAKYTIKLTNATAQPKFGPAFPLFVGNNCQTATPANINVKTPAGQSFDPSFGGNLAGKYTIPQFTGCNILVFPGFGSLVVNALVPGSNNTINLALSNGNLVVNP